MYLFDEMKYKINVGLFGRVFGKVGWMRVDTAFQSSLRFLCQCRGLLRVFFMIVMNEKVGTIRSRLPSSRGGRIASNFQAKLERSRWRMCVFVLFRAVYLESYCALFR